MPGKLDGFWEVYRVSPGDDGRSGQVYADTGAARRLGANVQVDIALGHSLHAPVPGWFVTAGFAIRAALPRVFRGH